MLDEQKAIPTAMGIPAPVFSFDAPAGLAGDGDGDGRPEIGAAFTVTGSPLPIAASALIELDSSGNGSLFDIAAGVPFGMGQLGRSIRSYGDIDHDGLPDFGVNVPFQAASGGFGAVDIVHLASSRGGIGQNVYWRTRATARSGSC